MAFHQGESPPLTMREEALLAGWQAEVARLRYTLRMIATEAHAPHLTPVEIATAALEEPDVD